MPTPFYVDNGVYSELPEPDDWQLFDAPEVPQIPSRRIRIPLQNSSDFGKSIREEHEEEDINFVPKTSFTSPPSPIHPTNLTAVVRAPLSAPLTVHDGNLLVRPSYTRKAKTNKRTVLDSSNNLDENEAIPSVTKTTKKTKTTRQKFPSSSLPTAPTPTLTAPTNVYNPPKPLPDGSYDVWENFVDSGGYKLTSEERVLVKRFVKLRRSGMT